MLTPEARPSSASATLDMTEAVSGATKTAKDNPSSAIGAITPSAREAFLPHASTSNASAAPSGPAISRMLAPILSASAPKGCDRKPVPRVNGRNVSPA